MSPSRGRSGVAAGLAATVFLTAGLVRASAQNAEPRFGVASIKRQTSAPNGFLLGVRMLPNGIDAGLSTVRMLMMAAYQVADYQIVGGPTAAIAERYQISARASGAVTPAVARQMLKNLLQDRFALKARTETREGDIQTLVLARSDGTLGPGLTRTRAECAEAAVEARKTPPDPDRPAPAAPTPPGCVRRVRVQDPTGLA